MLACMFILARCWPAAAPGRHLPGLESRLSFQEWGFQKMAFDFWLRRSWPQAQHRTVCLPWKQMLLELSAFDGSVICGLLSCAGTRSEALDSHRLCSSCSTLKLLLKPLDQDEFKSWPRDVYPPHRVGSGLGCALGARPKPLNLKLPILNPTP